jgi:hypothetical protein
LALEGLALRHAHQQSVKVHGSTRVQARPGTTAWQPAVAMPFPTACVATVVRCFPMDPSQQGHVALIADRPTCPVEVVKGVVQLASHRGHGGDPIRATAALTCSTRKQRCESGCICNIFALFVAVRTAAMYWIKRQTCVATRIRSLWLACTNSSWNMTLSAAQVT